MARAFRPFTLKNCLTGTAGGGGGGGGGGSGPLKSATAVPTFDQ